MACLASVLRIKIKTWRQFCETAKFKGKSRKGKKATQEILKAMSQAIRNGPLIAFRRLLELVHQESFKQTASKPILAAHLKKLRGILIKW